MTFRLDTIRYPIMAGSVILLLLGLWTGLERLGWMRSIFAGASVYHGPIMVSGFLGSLISLERIVGVESRWGYLIPACFIGGSVVLLLEQNPEIGPLLLVLGSAGLVVLFLYILYLSPSMHGIIMVGGTVLLLVGNGFWAVGYFLSEVVPLWTGFLILIIAGERLELSRTFMLSKSTRRLLGLPIGLYFLGGILVCWFPVVGWNLLGVGLMGISLWLMVFDPSGKTVWVPGKTRFMSLSLFLGYIWLLFCSGIMLYVGPLSGGVIYDAWLHSIFLGFVFSMIFAHAPVIFPAITGRSMMFHPIFYVHLLVLHGSLVVRVAGDLMGSSILREWGGMGNVMAILLFLLISGYAIVSNKQEHPS